MLTAVIMLGSRLGRGRLWWLMMIKVKSHAGDFFNEMVDTMCNECYIKV